MSPFQLLVYIRDLELKSTVSESRKVPYDNLCGERQSFTE